MTWLKKLKPEWNPQEHPGILVGDIVDFPGNVHKLVQEGSAALCDEFGNEVSTFDTLGVMTDRELQQFRAWREQQQQEALKKSLEAENDQLLAQAAEVRTQIANQDATQVATPVSTGAGTSVLPVQPVQAEPQTTGTVEDAQVELEQKRKEWGQKMAAARAQKAQERASQQGVAASA